MNIIDDLSYRDYLIGNEQIDDYMVQVYCAALSGLLASDVIQSAHTMEAVCNGARVAMLKSFGLEDKKGEADKDDEG